MKHVALFKYGSLRAFCAFACTLALGLAGCSAEETAEFTPADPVEEVDAPRDPVASEEPRTPEKPSSDPIDPRTPPTETQEDPGEPETADEPLPEPSPIDLGIGVELSLTPPIVEPAPPTRPRRRMDVDQLDAAMRTVTGGIGWDEPSGDNIFEALAGSMGKPDYLNSVIEDLSPSALFQKFLEDASRDVCSKLSTMETLLPETQGVLFDHITPEQSPFEAPDAVDANLRSLLLRFHGRILTEGAPGLEHWKWLLNSSYVIYQDPTLAWRTVCVGLFIHPDFYSY